MRKFESSDPLRRASRRPTAAALQAVLANRRQSRLTGSAGSSGSSGGSTCSTANTPGGGDAADLLHRQPLEVLSGAGFQEFTLKMCSEEDLADARLHVLKFFSKSKVDPAAQFTPPIRLHRKDPKQLQVMAGQTSDAEMEEDGDAADTIADDLVLGDGGLERARPERRRFGKPRKTRQIHGGSKNEAARKLRYEEHFPWVMEDFDGKNAWVSSYEAEQSNNFVVLTYDAQSNGFKVLPIEKFYKMTPNPRYATLSVEDAEKMMEDRHSQRDRWLMQHMQPNGVSPGGVSGPVAGAFGSNLGGSSGVGRGMRTVVGSEERQHKYNQDEEMDYDELEQFDDDEGAPLLDGPEEDLKEAEDRIKREHLMANELMEAGNDNDIDALFADGENARDDKQGRRVRKALRALEKNRYYDTDDEDNPYASSSDNSDSELEREELAAAQNGSAGQLGSGLPNAVKQEVDDHGIMLPLVSQFRRRHIMRDTLPRGTVVLQLQPASLAKFPRGEWNPNVKREPSEPVQDQNNPNLLTREDVRAHIVSGETNIKQLLTALKPRLALHESNPKLLKLFIKEIARSKDKKLYLRIN